MLLRSPKNQRMLLYILMVFCFFIFFVMQFTNGAVAVAGPEDGDAIEIEQTAKNMWDKAKVPLYYVAGAALAIGSVIFMFSRGSPEKTRQARLGLGVAIAYRSISSLLNSTIEARSMNSPRMDCFNRSNLKRFISSTKKSLIRFCFSNPTRLAP